MWMYAAAALADASVFARRLLLFAAASAMTLLSACGTLPPHIVRLESTALAPSSDTALGRIAAVSTPSPEQTGVRLMPLGVYSLDTRLQLVQRAQRSLDIQYYQFENDPTGRLLLSRLRDAALRGVRVRLLVDDLYTTHSDELLRELAAYPNVEVRLFNPFCCARNGGTLLRYGASLFDFKRLNHRMHNKLFIADGVMAIAGGRNIGDEYFLRSAQSNFVDIDAFVMGHAVRDMATIFDSYWNSDVVVPIEALMAPQGDAAQMQAAFSNVVDEHASAPLLELPPNDVLGYGPLAEDLEAGRVGLVWGTARAFADPPDKLLDTVGEAFQTSVTSDVIATIWGADSELVVTSPYLIPGPDGMKTILGLRDKGVRLVLMTNSLAATDEPLVHNGYSRYRTAMLKAGVELYEISPTRTQTTKRLGLFGNSLGRLHAKTAVIDRRTIFIGSMNLDARSANANTEFGMFIDSPALAKELLRVINISRLESSYRVRLAPSGSGLQWITTDGEKEVILGAEPESTWWLRMHNYFFGLFVPEQLL